MALTKEQRAALKQVTVTLLMEIRRQYLAAGASPLKHWDQLQSRASIATKTAATVDEWYSVISRYLHLPPADNSVSSALDALRVGVMGLEPHWLAMVEMELPALIALCRLEAERRKIDRDESGTAPKKGKKQ